MNGILSFLLLSLVAHASFAQLTVKPTATNNNSFLYIKGQPLFVKQAVNLRKNAEGSETEASLYLRREAQLIQGKGGDQQNTGDGVISVFQEGTSNAYDYNYWSSPVSDGSSENGNFGIRMLYAPVHQTKSVQAQITSALDGTSTPLTISQRWIHTFSGSEYSGWRSAQDDPVIPSGYGFSMKGVKGTDITEIEGRKNNPGNSQRYDFRGKPNNGAINIPVRQEEFTLIGNPFPSALDLSVFLLENSGSGALSSECSDLVNRKEAITGIAYFWDSVENGTSHYLEDYVGGYGVFSPVDPCTTGIYEKPVFKYYSNTEESETLEVGKHYDRRYLPIAQGFMVEGASNSEITFHNHHRIFKKEGENSDFKQASIIKNKDGGQLIDIPKIRLEVLINRTYTRSLTLAFWPTASPGTDLGMDAKSFVQAKTDIGWKQNEESFVIDVRPFQDSDEIPFFVKIEDEEASLRIKVLQVENLEIEEIFVLDNETMIYYPIMESSFDLDLEKGTYHDRFKLAFENNSQSQLKEAEHELQVYYNKQKDQIEIVNPSKEVIQSLQIFDLSGKEIYSEKQIVSEFLAVSTAALAKSIYIVKVFTEEDRKIIEKVTVSNSY